MSTSPSISSRSSLVVPKPEGTSTPPNTSRRSSLAFPRPDGSIINKSRSVRSRSSSNASWFGGPRATEEVLTNKLRNSITWSRIKNDIGKGLGDLMQPSSPSPKEESDGQTSLSDYKAVTDHPDKGERGANTHSPTSRVTEADKSPEPPPALKAPPPPVETPLRSRQEMEEMIQLAGVNSRFSEVTIKPTSRLQNAWRKRKLSKESKPRPSLEENPEEEALQDSYPLRKGTLGKTSDPSSVQKSVEPQKASPAKKHWPIISPKASPSSPGKGSNATLSPRPSPQPPGSDSKRPSVEKSPRKVGKPKPVRPPRPDAMDEQRLSPPAIPKEKKPLPPLPPGVGSMDVRREVEKARRENLKTSQRRASSPPQLPPLPLVKMRKEQDVETSSTIVRNTKRHIDSLAMRYQKMVDPHPESMRDSVSSVYSQAVVEPLRPGTRTSGPRADSTDAAAEKSEACTAPAQLSKTTSPAPRELSHPSPKLLDLNTSFPSQTRPKPRIPSPPYAFWSDLQLEAYSADHDQAGKSAVPDWGISGGSVIKGSLLDGAMEGLQEKGMLVRGLEPWEVVGLWVELGRREGDVKR